MVWSVLCVNVFLQKIWNSDSDAFHSKFTLLRLNQFEFWFFVQISDSYKFHFLDWHVQYSIHFGSVRRSRLQNWRSEFHIQYRKYQLVDSNMLVLSCFQFVSVPKCLHFLTNASQCNASAKRFVQEGHCRLHSVFEEEANVHDLSGLKYNELLILIYVCPWDSTQALWLW